MTSKDNQLIEYKNIEDVKKFLRLYVQEKEGMDINEIISKEDSMSIQEIASKVLYNDTSGELQQKVQAHITFLNQIHNYDYSLPDGAWLGILSLTLVAVALLAPVPVPLALLSGMVGGILMFFSFELLTHTHWPKQCFAESYILNREHTKGERIKELLDYAQEKGNLPKSKEQLDSFKNHLRVEHREDPHRSNTIGKTQESSGMAKHTDKQNTSLGAPLAENKSEANTSGPQQRSQ